MASNSCRAAGPPTEFYLTGPGEDRPTSEYRTEVTIPIDR